MNTRTTIIQEAILAVSALICSRAIFVFIEDPEGPNLLVVVVMAALLYVASSGAYRLVAKPDFGSVRKLSLTIILQIAIATALYLVLR